MSDDDAPERPLSGDDAAFGRPSDDGDGRCGDAALYLLGLLDDARAAQFQEHLRECAVCGDELGALAPAVEVLPTLVPQLPPPEHVKGRVMAIVRDEAAERQTRVAGAALGEHEHRQAGERSPPRRSARARRASRGWPRWGSSLSLRPATALLAGAALVVVLAVGVGLGAGVFSSSSSGGGTRVISAHVTLAGASAALHESGGHAWLTVAGMPQPRAGDVYEVWIKHLDRLPQPTSSLFTPTAAGAGTVAVPGNLGGASEVMVTQEPAGGSQVPTSSPVIVARLA
jgi:Anti-sigma-K factor rskA/Putative zinc-finger